MTVLHPLLAWAASPVAALLALRAVVAVTADGPPPLIVNESPSLAPGVYRLAPDAPVRPGALVVLPPPAAARAYLAGLGMPDRTPLLKRVAAAAGDRVCARPGAVDLPGQRVAVHLRDRAGRTLSAWAGCRTLAPGELFVLGDTAASYDSRYFGPVRSETARGPYRPVLLW